MVSYKDLALLAVSTVSAQAGEWTMTYDAYDSDQALDNLVDVTLHVHTHTPIQDYANPATVNYSDRREGGCVGFSSSYTKQTTSGSIEPWVIVSSDLNDCAVMDFIPASSDTVYIYMKRRVDNGPVGVGYLSTRADTYDQKDSETAYLSVTPERISKWKMITYDDGLLIQHSSSNVGNPAFSSIGWYLLAGMDAGQFIDGPSGVRTDLLLHDVPSGQYEYQTVFTIGDSDASSFLAFSSLALFASAAFSLF